MYIILIEIENVLLTHLFHDLDSNFKVKKCSYLIAVDTELGFYGMLERNVLERH